MKHVRAITIQCFWRVTIARKVTKIIRGIHFEKRQNARAVVIQTKLRHMLAVFALRREQDLAQRIRISKEEKSIIIRHWWRLRLAKKHAEELRRNNLQYIKENVILEMNASTVISAAWRGKKGRDICKEALLKRKARWKELWSDEESRYFYYNQVWCLVLGIYNSDCCYCLTDFRICVLYVSLLCTIYLYF